MNTNAAFEMIRNLGQSFQSAMLEHRLIQPGDGFESDLMNGLAGYSHLNLTDEDIPGITEAYQLVMKHCANAAWEQVYGQQEEDTIV